MAESDDFEARVGREIADAARQSAENVALVSPRLVEFGDDLQYLHQVILDVVAGEATANDALNWAQDQLESQ